jgi:hypothetical protein
LPVVVSVGTEIGSRIRIEKRGRHIARDGYREASQESEAGTLPDTEILGKMEKFNEQLMNAGVMLAADGLQPTSKSKRVRFSGEDRTVHRRSVLGNEGAVADSLDGGSG